MENTKRLFEKNLRLVYKVYHDKIERQKNAQIMQEDLIQIGALTLWKCCINYDPERGTSFSTYAYNAIYKNMMCALVRENKKTAYVFSINSPVNSGKEDCDFTYEDVIASPVNIASDVEIDDLVEQISNTIEEDANKVIEMVRKGYTQVEIAKKMHITRAKVGSMLKKFRKKLKNTLFFEE